LLSHVLEMEFAIETFHLTWDDVTGEEVKALSILRNERAKHEKERHDQDERNRQMQAALQR
jgi:hypothetical protein